MVQIASLLRKCYLFKNLPEENLKDFAQAAETKRYSKGDPIFLASEPSHRIYFIASGEVDIILNQRLSQGQKIRTLQSGEHMAELSVLTNSRHSVSAFAGSEVEVISIEGSRFVEVLHHHKDTCFSLAQTLAEQITINLKNSLSIRPLTEKKIHFSPLLSEIFPIGLIKKYQVVPLKILDKTIHIAVVLPLQDEFFSEYKKLNTNYDLQVSTIEEKDFEGLQQEFLAHIAGLQGKGATPDNRTENLFSSLEEMLPFSLMFSQLPKAVLDQVIPYFKAKKVKAGETIRAQGDEVQNLFLVSSGKIELSKKVPNEKLRVHIETAESTDFFAEESLCLKQPSSCDIIAVEDSEIYALPKPVFDQLLGTTDFLLPLCISFAFRLQTLNRLPGLDLGLVQETCEESNEMQTSISFTQKEEEEFYPLGKLKSQQPDRLLTEILSGASQIRSSDIHMEFQEDQAVIRCRVDGVISQPWESIKTELATQLVNRIKVLSELDISEKRRPQDGQLSIDLQSDVFNGRVSTTPTRFGEKIVIRVLSKQGTLIPLNQLAPHKGVIRFLNEIKKYKQGLFLVAGPTGSGKTTTLYSLLNEINPKKLNMVTIEDPVELDLHGANQIQLNNGIGLNYKSILKSVLRQDPDVILVGEIRDEESLQLVFEAALTGHLVLSTIHAPNSIQIIHRLLELGASPAQISSSLLGVMSQRLVRKVCDSCRKKRAISEQEKQFFHSHKQPLQLIYGEGCEKCNQSGFLKRIPIYEFWKNNAAISDAILHLKDQSTIKKILKTGGFQSMGEFGLEMVLNGLTTIEELESSIFGLFNEEEEEEESLSSLSKAS